MPREQAVLSPLPVGVWLAWTSATAPVARRPGARTPTFGFSGGLRWPKGRSRRQVEPRNHPQLRAFDLTSEEPHPSSTRVCWNAPSWLARKRRVLLQSRLSGSLAAVREQVAASPHERQRARSPPASPGESGSLVVRRLSYRSSSNSAVLVASLSTACRRSSAPQPAWVLGARDMARPAARMTLRMCS